MGSRASGAFPRRWLYAATAAALSMGAPLGLLALRRLEAGSGSRDWVRAQIAEDLGLFLYLTFSTLTVFLAFGYVLGRQADRLLEKARTDPLTGLFNARVFHERLEEEVARARRYGRPLCLLMIDVDGLKAVNDRGGHRAGDAALVRVAEALRGAARRTDVAARWGGDEFALLAPDTMADAAMTVGERIRSLVDDGRAGDPITVSVGVAALAEEDDAAGDGFRGRADLALYAAKREGRNRVVKA
jgi:diguanylate cyclase (GGDEF)-like protein